jgi:hypothetical protein
VRCWSRFLLGTSYIASILDPPAERKAMRPNPRRPMKKQISVALVGRGHSVTQNDREEA